MCRCQVHISFALLQTCQNVRALMMQLVHSPGTDNCGKDGQLASTIAYLGADLYAMTRRNNLELTAIKSKGKGKQPCKEGAVAMPPAPCQQRAA